MLSLNEGKKTHHKSGRHKLCSLAIFPTIAEFKSQLRKFNHTV